MARDNEEPAVRSPSIFSYVKPHRQALLGGVLLLLVTNGLDKTIPWLLQNAVDALTEGRLSDVGYYAWIVVAIAAVMWAVRSFSRIVIFNVGRDVEYELRNELLERVHRLGPSFFSKMSTGDIMSRATNDLGQVRLYVGFGALNIVNASFAYVGAFGLMLAISAELTLWALAPLPLFVLATRYFSRAAFYRSREAQEALSVLAERAQEIISGVRLVRAYAVEEEVEARFEEANQNALRKNMRLVVLRGVMWPVLMGLSQLGALIVIWRGGLMVLDGELTVGQFAAFNAYLGQLIWPTMAFGFLLSVIQRGRASYQRVRSVLDVEPDIQEVADPAPIGGEGKIEIRDLSFDRGEKRVLSHVDISVPAEGSVALVGRTGSGRSTLAALLPRLLPTPEGSVFLDDHDVNDLRLRELRRTVGFAQQDPFLFSSTVAANIGLALDDPEEDGAMDSIRDAAAQAAILDEIESMPEGFDTVVGERGVQLSGGQKQRISLARALLNKPRVLILDDPLSAVDARTERTILNALDRAGEGRTLVLITNRIAASSKAEQIVVFDAGRVVERGTHEELVAAGGLYSRLAERQAIEQELRTL